MVETDAKYIHGMLNHPEMGPNATINRWIEKILMFHFELRHVAGKTFGPDGLSRRDRQEGDKMYPPDEDLDEIGAPLILTMEDGTEPPLEFEKFKDKIDTCGRYFQDLPTSVSCFYRELALARYQCEIEREWASKNIPQEGPQAVVAQFTNQLLLPKEVGKDDGEVENYPEDQRTKSGRIQDEHLPLIKKWLQQPFVKPAEMEEHKYRKLVRMGTHFFMDKEGRLYRRGVDSAHKLVVGKERQMYMMRASHDSLGNQGFYVTKTLIAEQFWWPEMEHDVSWYCKCAIYASNGRSY